MAKYFLGSVGKAEAFRRDENGNLKLAFVSKTLTTSGLTISTTKDDIRAGEGAPIQFSFYHDASVEINLTDVVFKTEYIEAQLGAEFKSANAESYKTSTVTFDNGSATLEEEIRPLPFPCGGNEYYAAWAAKQGSDEWQMVEVAADHKGLTLSGADGTYCVRYLALDSRARVAEITSTIIPQELYLVITAPIFAGDSCAASKGKAAGSIQFEVPRFSLNGSQEFTMEMSSNQTMSLAGVALASESADCDAAGGKLLRIIEVITDRKWYDDITEIIVDEDCLKVNSKPVVYGLNRDGSLTKADNSDITFNPALNTNGTFKTAGATTLTVTKKPSITDSVTVVA